MTSVLFYSGRALPDLITRYGTASQYSHVELEHNGVIVSAEPPRVRLYDGQVAQARIKQATSRAEVFPQVPPGVAYKAWQKQLEAVGHTYSFEAIACDVLAWLVGMPALRRLGRGPICSRLVGMYLYHVNYIGSSIDFRELVPGDIAAILLGHRMPPVHRPVH